MLSSILHLLYIILAVAASWILFNDYRKSKGKNKYLRNFAIFFLLFVFYRIFLSLYIFTGSAEIAGRGYNISVMILFLMVTVIIDLSLSMLGSSNKKRKLINAGIISVGIIIFIIQTIYFRLPIIYPNGIIVWNANPITSFMTGLSGFVAGITFAYILGTTLKSSNKKIDRVKAMLLTVGLILIAFASLTYYYSNYYSMIASFTMSFLGSLSLLVAVSVSYMKKRRQ